MENNYSTQESNQKGLALTDLSCDFLRETVKWTKFLSIMGFIGIAFMIVGAIFMGIASFAIPSSGSFTRTGIFPFAPGLFSIIYLIFALVYACPVYFLYKFSVDTRQALDQMNPNLLEEGLSYLKSHYKFMGIMIITILSIYALAIISGILIGITAMTRL